MYTVGYILNLFIIYFLFSGFIFIYIKFLNNIYIIVVVNKKYK